MMMNILINILAWKSCYKMKPTFENDSPLGLLNSSLLNVLANILKEMWPFPIALWQLGLECFFLSLSLFIQRLTTKLQVYLKIFIKLVQH